MAAFSEAQKAAVARGFQDNLTTYALISSIWTSTFALGAFVGPTAAGENLLNSSNNVKESLSRISVRCCRLPVVHSLHSRLEHPRGSGIRQHDPSQIQEQ